MKKTLFALVLFFAALAVRNAAAQTSDFRVLVCSAEEPVGYAYVLINDAVHSMTDAEGMTRIPAGKLKAGDTLSARFVGMESVPLVWDGNVPAGSVIELELIPNIIDNIVVTARGRDRSKQLFRRNVDKIPTHGWYTGFRGDYHVRFGGKKPWTSQGKYIRNHVPGEDANLRKVETFSLQPTSESGTALSWQTQRNILLVCSMAERAVQLNGSQESNKGMIINYRGQIGEQNVFLIIKPYFDTFTSSDDSFQTMIYVDAASGLITFSETVSRTRYGIWNVSANYAVYSGELSDKSVRFIYTTRVQGNYQERNPDAEDPVEIDVSLENIVPRHFTPEPIPQKNR